MKAKVIDTFRDKYTKENYKKGQVIEVSKRRFEEMNSTAFGVLVEAVSEKPKQEQKKKTEAKSSQSKKTPPKK